MKQKVSSSPKSSTSSSVPTVRPNSLKAWFLASRPKTLTAALIPVATATALAYAEGHLSWIPALLCALFAGLMQIAANMINDLYDFRKGSDRADRLGPERACAQGWITPKAMQRGIFVMLALACMVGCGLIPFGGPRLILIGVACVIFAFLYTTLLSYMGGGDLLVWVFFGFIPVCGTYFVQAHTLTPSVWLLGAGCGLASDTLLVLNNYRDRAEDTISGKRTLIVVWGEQFGSLFYLLQGIAAYICVAFMAYYGHIWACIFPLFYLLPHFLTWRNMVKINHGRELNRILGFTSRNMLTFALLIVVSLVL